jgi:hypothetical protein
MRSVGIILLVLAIVGSAALPGPAADEKARQFPEPGTTVPRSFSPLVINGNWKDAKGDPVDRYHSVVCHFGLKPVVLLFARDPKDDALFDFLKQLEGKVAANQEVYLSGSAIFLAHDEKRDKADLEAKDLIETANDKEKLVKLLKEKAKTAGLKEVLVGIDSSEGPKGFHIKPRADVTVILYYKHQVVDSKDYKRGEFDEKAAAAVLKKVDALVARIKGKPAPKKRMKDE